MRRGAKRPKPKGRAKAAAARKAKKPVISRAELERRLAEAREQQAATSEVLKLISRSTFDLEPVLQTLMENAARLCDADQGIIWRFDGEVFRAAAHHMISSELQDLLEERPLRPGRGSGAGRAAMERRTIHIADVLADPEYERGDLRTAFGFRSLLAVPMVREERLVGVFSLHRLGVSSFTEKQIELVTGFADQAVIAIENVRLFTELQARNQDLTVALDQQMATSDILRVISGSQTDIQPVFDAIVRSAVRLCGADHSIAARFDGGMLYPLASYGFSPEARVIIERSFPMRPTMENMLGRATVKRAVDNLPDMLADPEYSREYAMAGGWRSGLAVPMLRDGQLIGAIAVSRTETGAFPDHLVELLKTFADQAVIAIENVRLFTELEKKNDALTRAHAQVSEALEQQTATAEILRVISRSPTDVQPVFDTIVRSAVRLCDGLFSAVYRFDGEVHYLVAQHNYTPEALAEVHRIFPARATRDLFTGRAILDRALIHIPDVELDQEFQHHSLSRAIGFRSGLFVPMLREGAPIGVIIVARAEPGRFSDDEIELLKTFADQAVIAVENVRLFTELEKKNEALTQAHAQVSESLEQQTATSEILRVISTSPTDLQPVFDTIVESVVQLCGGVSAFVYRFDGELIHLAAHHHTVTSHARETFERRYPTPPSRVSMIAQSILDRAIVHVRDFENDPDVSSASRDMARAANHRSTLAVPMLRQGQPIGAIAVGRRGPEGEPLPFSDNEIELLKTFADQAVIAIENVRLFRELQEKNSALAQAHGQVTEALEQQTATAEILRVISRSQTDVQPVFDTIVRSVVSLCDGLFSTLYRFDGELIHRVAQHNYRPEALEASDRIFPARPTRALLSGRAILDRAVVHVADVDADPEFQHPALPRAIGWRSGLFVPMLREGAPIGSIAVTRAEPGPFSANEIELLKTFADQAVIAVENVRLFTELQATNHELTTALDQQTATSDILRVISRSQTDVQPVFQTILDNAKRLLGAFSAMVVQRAGAELHLAALSSVSDVGDARVRQAFPIHIDEVSRAGPLLTPIRNHQPFVISDAETQPGVGEEAREIARARGYRSQLVVPLLREDSALGVISVTRREAGGFTREEVELLKVFADQAVIAIENVRLFTELQQKNGALTQAHAQVSESLEQQTATSEILRVMSQSQTDVQPVFDTIVRSAMRLCDGLNSVLFQFDGEMLHYVAQHNVTPEGLEELHRVFPARPTRALGSGRAILERAFVHIPDTELDPEFQNLALSRGIGFRSGLWVPMLREGAPIGVIAVNRAKAGPFSDSVVELLKTFADQAVIAVENVRLFTELQATNHELTTALDQQTATSDILRVISQSQTDVQPVFDAIVTSAVRLLRGNASTLSRIEGDLIALAAMTRTDDPGDASQRARFPMSVHSEGDHAQAVRNRVPLHSSDAHNDPRLPEAQHASARLRGYRSLVVVPLVRHDEAVGALGVSRREPGGFTGDEIALLKTFADQAVIAIENVRLFKELEARTGELTQSVEQLTALGEVSRAVSSTLDVETVLDTIVSRASQLAGADGCAIYEYDDATEAFHIRATHNLDPTLVETLRAAPLRKREGAMGRAAETREPTQVADIAAPGAYQSHIRDTLLDAGYRALLSVPLLREGEIIGSLSLNRHTPGEFPAEAVEVLKTFATQSALAIQNARLFREIADKSAQLEAASRHKSEFLANMSHELRTPLNAIIGFSEILAEKMFGDINEKQTEYLQDILESGRHLLSLINDILDLSKIEAGRMELELSEFDLPQAIENALILVRERASRRGILLGSTIDPRLAKIDGDERKVKQVLLNLLSNALKFTPEGGRIDVGARLDGDMAEVSVTDTGIGIAPEDQAAVFEEFRQVGTADKKAEGTGLGLALSRKFIELHGGRIWVKSQVGAGSTFSFTLPLSR